MLLFNNIIRTVTTKYNPQLLWRLSVSLCTNSMPVTSNYNEQETRQNQTNDEDNKTFMIQSKPFNELKTKLCSDLSNQPLITYKIEKAQDINELIKVMKDAKENSISQSDVLNALKFIMEWSLTMRSNAVQNLDFKNANPEKHTKIKMKTIKDQPNDVRNNILISNQLSTPKLVKEIHTLAKQGNRNVQLLNSHFESIINNNNILSISSCSTLLFSMGWLHYSNERLLKIIAENIINLKNMLNGKICKSILNSMAVIRYKNDACLNHICEEIINHHIKCRPNEIVNILHSFAMLDYCSKNVLQIIKEYITDAEFMKLTYSDKLNFVWSCTLFNILDGPYAQLVLNKNFISELTHNSTQKNEIYKLKLLNINAYAKYVLKSYHGPFFKDDSCTHKIIEVKHLKKQPYISILETALKRIFPSVSHFQMNIDTKMGFYLDAELGVDSNFNYIDICNIEDNKDFYRIAIIIVDYHHTYLGQPRYTSLIKLYHSLLKCKNYIVFCIPYCNLNLEDKIDKHVNYIRSNMLQLLKNTVEPIKLET